MTFGTLLKMEGVMHSDRLSLCAIAVRHLDSGTRCI